MAEEKISNNQGLAGVTPGEALFLSLFEKSILVFMGERRKTYSR